MWLNRFSRFLVFATFLLIIAGGLVTSNDYGLAVPDWPKSYGVWMPQMIGGVLYEHGHRMIAASVGFLTIILAFWLLARDTRRWVKVLGFVALLAVILQGVLGGLTVLFLLPTPISVLHATLAQTFFCLLVSIALFISKEWWARPESLERRGGAPGLFLATTLSIYGQLILGAWMRHSKAALAIPTFPLAFGKIIPPFASPEIAIHFAHRVGALVAFGLISATLVTAIRHYRNQKRILYPAILLFCLSLAQVTLGAYAVLTATAVPVATAHVAVGAVMLATSVVLALRGYRILVRERKRIPEISAVAVGSSL